jgi:hypothetical protein
MSATASQAISITPQKATSRYVALDLFNSSKIIAEGTTMASTIKKAKALGQEFSIMFVPKPNQTYIL